MTTQGKREMLCTLKTALDMKCHKNDEDDELCFYLCIYRVFFFYSFFFLKLKIRYNRYKKWIDALTKLIQNIKTSIKKIHSTNVKRCSFFSQKLKKKSGQNISWAHLYPYFATLLPYLHSITFTILHPFNVVQIDSAELFYMGVEKETIFSLHGGCLQYAATVVFCKYTYTRWVH